MASDFVNSSARNGSSRNVVKFDVGVEYHLLQTIGTGAYGVVCSALHKPSDQKVAIKKIANAFEILTTAKRTLRELKLLLHFKHENIVGVKNILHCVSKTSNIQDVYVVMDLMESDLHHVIRSQQPLTEKHICYFVYQLLRGLKYIHSGNVIHRDLKPSNLLVNENCELKIGDFGMARGVANSPEDNRNFMTEYVATRWYRAPELMLSMSEYSMAIDMWSVGCIFAEMIARKQLFPGRHYVHQLQLIISVLGSPSSKLVGSIRSERVKSYVLNLPHKKAVSLRSLFPKASSTVIDLLSRFLQFDPSCRKSAEAMLNHSFFQEYHDQDDEPNCPKPFDFRFETAGPDGPTKESVKKQVTNLIDAYHAKRNRLKKQLIFLPKSPNSTADQANLSPNKFLETTSTMVSKSGEQNLFKKPTFLPPGKPPVLKVTKAKNADSCDSIEIMSAKSETSSSIDTNVDTSDIQMLSARSSVSQQSDSSTVQDDTKENGENLTEKGNKCGSVVKKTISEKTKMLVRDTILASMLAKKNGISKPVEKTKKPVTAAERQREREIKRKKRQEKAAEKERKKRETEGTKPKLSDQDKNLLERWSKMQAQSKTPSTNIPESNENASANQTLISPNTLRRQNSLPSPATPRERTQSNRELVPVTRRWSYNDEFAQNFDSNDQYVPTLSDIPPSPIAQSSIPAQNHLLVISDIQKNYSEQDRADVIPVMSGQGHNSLFYGRATNSQQYASGPLSQVQPIQPMPPVYHGTTQAQSSGLPQVSFQPYKIVQNSDHVNVAPVVRQNTLPVAEEVKQGDSSRPILRPSTLVVGGNQSKQSSGGMIGISMASASDTLLTSSKCLVTLSPDTVDFVLNQEFQQSTEQRNASGNDQTANFVGTRDITNRKDSGGILTLSPGKTSLLVKASHEQHLNPFLASEKSASIEFSPRTFFSELDKCSNDTRSQAFTAEYDSEAVTDQNYDNSKFFHAKNGSVLLSDSAACNKNETLYVNSNLTHNPLKPIQHDCAQHNTPFMNEGMVGGYGIGYEPGIIKGSRQPAVSKIGISINDEPQSSFEMECESATSSSSLLNDWLEVSQMQEQDIEQLQRELELGSPMCIDDFRPE